jgi:hypothetical protein
MHLTLCHWCSSHEAFSLPRKKDKGSFSFVLLDFSVVSYFHLLVFLNFLFLQDDIIPRLSAASLERLRKEILQTDW